MSTATAEPAAGRVTVTQTEAARMAGVSVRTISRWEEDGKLKSKKIGRLRLYPVKKLMELVGAEE